jgi:ATP-binding cassette, subfamily B, bacterial
MSKLAHGMSAALRSLPRPGRRRDEPSPWAFFKDFPRVLPYLRPHKRLGFASLGVACAATVAALLSPWPLALMVDTVLGNKPLPSLLGFLGGLDQSLLLVVAVVSGVLVTALQSGLGVVDDYVNTKLDQSMVLDLRTDLFEHAQSLSLAYHDKKRTGHLMYQINNQAAAVGKTTVSIPPLVQSVLTLVGMFVVVLTIQPTLALLSLTVVPFIYKSAGYYARRIDPEVRRVRSLEGQSLTIVHEAMAMLRVIVAFGRERYEHTRFRRQAEDAVDARVRLTVRQTTFQLAVTVITALGTAVVLAYGAHTVLDGGMTAGELLVVMGYVAAIYKPLEEISQTVTGLQVDIMALQGALDLLDTPPEIEERPGAKAITNAAGGVGLENVSFSYAGRGEAVSDVSFDVAPGKRVAIVGPTGAGKSTLLNLIPRFYDPQAGRVLIDGHDVRDLKLSSLRAQVSMVLQEPLLFSGSIEDNIRYGRVDASTDDVIEAARAANAHEFISSLPKGYETELGERGAQLSGGERQRISVARAFLRDAPILILDEPTSSIDSKTESVILEALERLAAGRTTFMVAHRLSTVVDADLILVINHGEVAEQGRHDELMLRSGLYRELWEAQHGARRLAAAALSPADLSKMTGAITEARETGTEVSGSVLADLARAMAARGGKGAADGDEAQSAAWLLLGAAWPLLRDGSADRLRELAERRVPDGLGVNAAARMARHLLGDLGVQRRDESPPRAVLNGGAGRGARRRIVLLGMIAKVPVPGLIWQTVHYLLGFQRLGFDVYYVEAHGRTPGMLMSSEADDSATLAAELISTVMRSIGFGDRWAYQALHDDGRYYGMSEATVERLYREAELVINLHGGTRPRPEYGGSDRLIYIETDPVRLQIQLHNGVQETRDFLAQHAAFFTFAENLGRPGCDLPVPEEFHFQPTRQPVVLDHWAGRGAPAAVEPFTTVANWHQPWHRVRFGDRVYTWTKDERWKGFMDLPERTGRRFELALSGIEAGDVEELVRHGWDVRDAMEFGADTAAYRDYIAGSRAEFTVAKDQNVSFRTGWFSDRSATYLAAGRPVVTEDTGFGDVLPVGEGLFAVANVDEAAAAVEAIDGDYARHSRAASEIAQEQFRAERVLGELLSGCGVSTVTRARSREPDDDALRTLSRRRTRELVARMTPEGATVLVVSRGDGELVRLASHSAWHFPQVADGVWAGHHPADSGAAIAHLEQLRARGAEFIVFPFTSMWWLDHYQELRRHLERDHRPLFEDRDHGALFDLRHPSPVPA